ncbi:hypothetical protein ONZ45_g16973 [Pleurotus djamor]|nr:hypothetical protein ONZ45_g16973 [Pleurotus djamor]
MVSASRTPLPMLQLAIVLLIQAAEPLTASVILPFINQFVFESGITGGDERTIGYYAGIIGSLFFFTECLFVLFWSRLSDRVGRKPILLGGMLGLSLTILSAGATKSYYLFALSRSLQGVFNGNVGVSRTVMVEITDPSNMADAFSFFPPVSMLGSTVGPLIGGTLSHPATRWPSIFGNAFFREYPYFLPCAAVSLFPLLCFIIGVLKLNETFPSTARRADHDYRSDASADSSSETEPLLTSPTQANKSSPSVSSVLIRPVRLCLVTSAFRAITTESFRALMPLMFSTSIPNGGLAMSSARIGTILAIWGLCNGVFQLLCFAPFNRWLGSKRAFQIAYGSYLISFGAYPVMSYLAKQGGKVDGTVLVVLGVQQVFAALGAMAYGCNQLLVIGSVPNHQALATVNGVAQVVNSMMKAIAPALASSLFSVSVQHNIVDGYFVYVFLLGIVAFGLYVSTLLPRTSED